MQKGKLIYLVSCIIIFIILMIPYFQNGMINPSVQFFWKQTTFLGTYMWTITFGIGLGVCIVLYIQSLFEDINKRGPEKFNLE